MKTIMIHEIEKWMLNVQFDDDDILTFDDGLYSQFINYDKLPKENTKIFFISTGIICSNNTIQNKESIMCSEAHRLWFENNDLSNYMNIDQIKFLSEQENTFIGLHSHFHNKLDKFNSLYDQVNFMKNDISLMNAWWMKTFPNTKPFYFCWPYNKENKFYSGLLKQLYPHIQFFGWERTNINEYNNEK